MKDIEREKARKIVERIESGNFDENDVDNLFMRLRAYSSTFRVFREFGDLVAHNDERDRGLATDVLLRMQLGMRYLTEFVLTQKEVDYSRPFPNYMRRLLKLQIAAAESERLRNDFRVTAARLSTRVDQLFKAIKGTDQAELVADKIPGETLAALRYVVGRIPTTPAFTQADLVRDLVGVLQHNKIPFNASRLQAASPKITLCAMLSLHSTRFNLGTDQTATCLISSGLTPTQNGLVPNDNLQVSGLVSAKSSSGNDLQLLTWVMTSDLPTEDWTEPRLLVKPGTEDGWRIPLQERPMILSPRFRLDSLQ